MGGVGRWQGVCVHREEADDEDRGLEKPCILRHNTFGRQAVLGMYVCMYGYLRPEAGRGKRKTKGGWNMAREDGRGGQGQKGRERTDRGGVDACSR